MKRLQVWLATFIDRTDMTRRGFRRLIILQWLLGLASVVVYFATLSQLPPELKDYWEAQKNVEQSAGMWILLAIGMVVLIASIVIYLGLYWLRAWAKQLLLPINIIALLMMPFYGPTVQSGWASTLSYLYALVNGGILFLVYLSPVSQMFVTDGDV